MNSNILFPCRIHLHQAANCVSIDLTKTGPFQRSERPLGRYPILDIHFGDHFMSTAQLIDNTEIKQYIQALALV